jgi:acyl-coenzyme A synthetase/AMP-(fatty) acid ligase
LFQKNAYEALGAKAPKIVLKINEIPRNETGKILREDLKALTN